MTAQQLPMFEADAEVPRSFEQDYEGLVIEFARKRRGRFFSSEDVTTEAIRRGIIPSRDFRCTGTIYTRLESLGVIRRPEEGGLYRRAFGNGTKAQGWVGV